MANEIETEIKVIKSAKSVKRVRFSDEVKRVDFHESDDSGSFSLENEYTNVSIISIERPNDVNNEDNSLSNNPNDTIDESLGPDDNNNNELLSYPQNVTITYPSSANNDVTSEVEPPDQSECNLTDETVEIDDTSRESPELMDLINETKSMTISHTSVAKLIPESSLEEKNCHPYSCGKDLEKSDCTDFIQDISEKSIISSSSRKRSLEGVLLDKQTSKLNICLRKNNSEYGSADKLKSAVFKAWNEVKNESYVVQTLPNVPYVKKSNDVSDQSTSHRAYDMWKKSKIRSKKANPKISEQVTHKSKSKKDLEESKLAFNAWKKRKDEVLKHQMTEKYRKEEKARSVSLMSERTRKNDAETAFSAWNAHKSVTLKLEKKRRQWFLEKDKEKEYLKIKKNNDAIKVYHDWLRNKVYSESTNTFQMYEDKPPWTPPGKGSNLM